MKNVYNLPRGNDTPYSDGVESVWIKWAEQRGCDVGDFWSTTEKYITRGAILRSEHHELFVTFVAEWKIFGGYQAMKDKMGFDATPFGVDSVTGEMGEIIDD